MFLMDMPVFSVLVVPFFVWILFVIDFTYFRDSFCGHRCDNIQRGLVFVHEHASPRKIVVL